MPGAYGAPPSLLLAGGGTGVAPLVTLAAAALDGRDSRFVRVLQMADPRSPAGGWRAWMAVSQRSAADCVLLPGRVPGTDTRLTTSHAADHVMRRAPLRAPAPELAGLAAKGLRVLVTLTGGGGGAAPPALSELCAAGAARVAHGSLPHRRR
eukprot:gene34773-59726_t